MLRIAFSIYHSAFQKDEVLGPYFGNHPRSCTHATYGEKGPLSIYRSPFPVFRFAMISIWIWDLVKIRLQAPFFFSVLFFSFQAGG